MVKVLIVDDSAFVRQTLTTILTRDKSIEIVGEAKNGAEALVRVTELDPDVVTMDIEMPVMDGLSALRRIMESSPRPVIMLSSGTAEGADLTLKSLEYGALDYMAKPGPYSPPYAQNELINKIKALARRKAYVRLVHGRKYPEAARALSLARRKAGREAAQVQATNRYEMPPVPAGAAAMFDCVAVGVSTGGPPAVQKILSVVPENFPSPILIAQHMPAAFTGPFAKRLDTQTALTVKEAEPVERLRPGTVYICPGGRHIRLENQRGSLFVVVSEEPVDALYKPSASILLESVGKVLGRRSLGVILTGMGSDGLEGARVLKDSGGMLLAQSEATCVVYGMPKAVVDAGLADEIVDLDDMAAAIVSSVVK